MDERQSEVKPELKARFCKAWESLGGESPERAFEQVVSRYRRGRYYHTMGHVTQMLELADQVIPPGALSAECLVAIFMHDVVYDPERDDNETRSADLARQMLAGAPAERIDKIAELIKATRSHVSDDPEAQILIDLDLAPLGAEPDVFESNVRKLIEEFHHIPSKTFLMGQAGYLQRFLSRPTIFYTAPFKERFEKQARENINRFILTHGNEL